MYAFKSYRNLSCDTADDTDRDMTPICLPRFTSGTKRELKNWTLTNFSYMMDIIYEWNSKLELLIKVHARIQGDNRGSRPPTTHPALAKSQQIRFYSKNISEYDQEIPQSQTTWKILVRSPWKITKLPNHYSILGNHLPAIETPFKWRLSGSLMMAYFSSILTLSPYQVKKCERWTSSDKTCRIRTYRYIIPALS